MKKAYKFLIGFSLIIALAAAMAVMSSAANQWIGSWSTAMTNISLKNYSNISFKGKDMTGRTVITPTASGTKVKLRFSNHYGDEDVTINSVTIAPSKSSNGKVSSAIDVNKIAPVTFKGYAAVTIPAGEEVISDEIDFKITALEDVAVSYYVADSTEIKTMGLSGGSTYLAVEGDKTKIADFSLISDADSSVQKIVDIIKNLGIINSFDIPLSSGLVSVVPLFSGLDVYSDANAYSVCIIGDSTVANKFPQYLAENIIKNENVTNVGVMGKGIIGNTLATISEGSLGAMIYGESLLDRFERDCLSQSGVKYVIVKIGANDIMHPVCTNAAAGAKQPTANEIIANLQEVCDRAHKAGKKVILGTITQWKGTTRDYFKSGGTYIRNDDEFEADWKIATDVNKWIKSSNNTYHDGYIDFAALSASSVDSAALDSGYTSDFIHPNDALQQKWGSSVNMSLIGVSTKMAQLQLSASTLKINVGATKTIKVSKYIPDTAAVKGVTWKSSNEAVATITSGGKITALSNGTTTITATATDGSKVKATCKVTVVTPVSSVSVSPATKTIYTRDTLQLTASVLPSNATTKTVKWTTGDKEIATVSSKGLVTAVRSGKVTITATTTDGAKVAKATITVKKRVDVALIEPNVSKKNMYVGKTYQLSATVYPTNATYPQVKYSSANKSIATVNSAGLVTAVAPGETKITIKSVDNPSVKATVTIKVYKHVSGVTVSPASAALSVGQTKTLTPTVKPATAFVKTVTYKSSDKSVAKVNSNGKVTAVGVGTAVITVTTTDGGYTATSVFHVTPHVAPASVRLNANKKTVYVKRTATLTATVLPDNTSDKSVTWTSSDSSIAKVSAKGVVTGVKAGTVTIYCSTKENGKTAKCTVTIKNVVPDKLILKTTKLSLNAGKSSTLKTVISPSDATNKTVKWSSSNPKIAKVSSSGKVTAVKPGTCTITAKTASGGKTATCKVTVKAVKVTSLKLSATSITLNAGTSRTLKATASPSNATNKAVTWKSSNTKVATVSASGVVKAVGKGKATITATAKDGSGKTAKCSVTVNNQKVTNVKLSKTQITLTKGKTQKLTATVSPSSATNKTIRWISTNTKVATVSSSGVITAVGTGDCFIKAVAADGGATGVCKVIVAG